MAAIGGWEPEPDNDDPVDYLELAFDAVVTVGVVYLVGLVAGFAAAVAAGLVIVVGTAVWLAWRPQ